MTVEFTVTLDGTAQSVLGEWRCWDSTTAEGTALQGQCCRDGAAGTAPQLRERRCWDSAAGTALQGQCCRDGAARSVLQGRRCWDDAPSGAHRQASHRERCGAAVHHNVPVSSDGSVHPAALRRGSMRRSESEPRGARGGAGEKPGVG